MSMGLLDEDTFSQPLSNPDSHPAGSRRRPELFSATCPAFIVPATPPLGEWKAVRIGLAGRIGQVGGQGSLKETLVAKRKKQAERKKGRPFTLKDEALIRRAGILLRRGE